MLISILPIHRLLFGAHHGVLSRLRLRVLEPEDARILRRLTDILDFIHRARDLTDEELARRTRTLEVEPPSTFLPEPLRFRMEQRTQLAAQRRDRRSEISPPRELGWGYWRWVGHIERNWYEPVLRLEQLKLAVTRAHRDRMSEGHWFDF